MKSRNQRFEGNGDKVRTKLQAEGLLDEEGRLTPQGYEWTDRLMEQYRAATREVRELEDA
jgi:hypothetical protein